jgi:hypothetical protein
MKIIQLLAAIDGESPGTIGSQVYGLGDNGAMYELVSPSKPRRVGGTYTGPVPWYPGHTGGWKLVATSDERDEEIPAP